MQTLILKRSIVFVATAFVVSLLIQLLLVIPTHATTGNDARAWTGGAVWDGGGDGTSFNDAANWETDTLPVSGDAISLNTEGMTGGTFNVNLDTEGDGTSAFDYIRLGGSGSGTYTLTGEDIALATGLDNDGDLYNYQTFVVENNITLTGDSDFRAGAKLIVGKTDGSSTLNLGSFTMTKKGEYPLKIYSVVSGTGGVTVSNGNFVALEDSTIALVIGSGGTLMGNATVGDVTVQSGGTVAPGQSPGCLTTGDLTFNSGSTFTVELNGGTVCAEYDQTQVTGTVTLGNATLDIQKLASYDPTAGGATFVIIDNDGTADAVVGTFNGLAEGDTTDVAGVTYTVSYTGGDGNDVTLTVADAPAAPNTGFGSIATNYIFVALATIALAGGIVFTARKHQKTNA